MPKRWKIVPKAGERDRFTFQLLDGNDVYESDGSWKSPDDVDKELDKITNGDIEFPDGSEQRPEHHR
jgi:hypothetical protein